MQDIVTYIKVSPRVRVHLSFQPLLEIPEHIEEEVDRLWDNAKSEKEIVNSPLFCLTSHDEERIFGRFSEYRYLVAMQQNPELRELLDLYPLGVSAITICDGSVLVGTRDAKLALYPGYLELVPSGSIETRACQHGEVDFFMQLMWELEEEAHIAEKYVKEIHPLGLFYSKDVGVYDLGMIITCSLKDYQMAEFESSKEYPLLRWLSFEEWQKQLDSPDAKIVPLSKALWQAYISSSR